MGKGTTTDLFSVDASGDSVGTEKGFYLIAEPMQPFSGRTANFLPTLPKLPPGRVPWFCYYPK
jgi:hypothetical protein